MIRTNGIGGISLLWASIAWSGLLGCATTATTTRTPRAAGSEKPAAGQDRPGWELYTRGIALAQAQDHVRAEQYLVAARLRGYSEAEVTAMLVRVLVAANRLRAALGYAEPYLRRHPEAHALRHVVASVHLALDQVEQARRSLDRVLDAWPDHAPSHYLSAVILRDRLGDPTAARAAFERYLHFEPQGPHAREAESWLQTLETPVRSEPAPEVAP